MRVFGFDSQPVESSGTGDFFFFFFKTKKFLTTS